MSETASSRAAIMHIIPFVHWEREGRATLEHQRARLLDLLAEILLLLKSGTHFVLLGGQTVILEDAAQIRPDLVTELISGNSAGKIEIGPWYVHPYETLVSGESLIRNLLLASVDADRYAVTLTKTAYMPEIQGHPAQLPQILAGFDVNAALLHHGAPVLFLPFRWEGKDGTSLLVVSDDIQGHNPYLSLRKQRVTTPDGPYLWLQSVAATGDFSLSIPVSQTRLSDYIALLRKSMPDRSRPALRGELRLQTFRPGGYLLPGALSARIPIKQRNAYLQNLLTFSAEPLLAIALTHGEMEHAENMTALLEHGWRTLVKAQGYAVLGGHGTDAVHAHQEVCFRQVEDIAAEVTRRALRALPGTLANGPRPAQAATTYVKVWNPHNWRVQQVVEIALALPPAVHPAHLISPEGDDQLFGWSPETHVINFVADVPPVGYAVYTVELSEKLPQPVHLTQRANASTIADTGGATLSAEGGELFWRHKRGEVASLLRYYDGGDAGDTYNYSAPLEDSLELAQMTGDIQVETSALYERLLLRHRMRIAPGLRADRNRDRGVRLLELITTATFYDSMPGIYFSTRFTNNAADHRLRAHLRTGLYSETLRADSAFSVIERAVRVEAPLNAPRPGTEGITSTHPLLTGAMVDDGTNALALVTRGLHEYEGLHENRQVTLALTLLRAVGWISRDDLRTRSGAVGTVLDAPGAQSERAMTADYALVPVNTGDDVSLLRAGQLYNAPLRAYQYSVPPEKLRRSYLSVMTNLGHAGESDANGAILTALKPPLHGRGWIVRLFNPTAQQVEARVTPHERTRYARIVSMAEEPQSILEPDGIGSVHVTLPPHRIITLRLGFD